MITCYPSAGKKKALSICERFAAGCGGKVESPGMSHLRDGPAFFYGWTPHTAPLIAQCIQEDREWFYADNAYYFGRGRYYRVTRNRLMHDGYGAAPDDRLRALGVQLEPWKFRGQAVIVATQSELFYAQRHGLTRTAWVAKVAEWIRPYPVAVYDKPPPTRGKNEAAHPGFERALPTAWAMVTYSSSSAVKAITAGVPVYSHQSSMCGPVGLPLGADLDNPRRVSDDERWQWLANLAANQWTLDEMSDGKCWADLNA